LKQALGIGALLLPLVNGDAVDAVLAIFSLLLLAALFTLFAFLAAIAHTSLLF